MSLRFKRHYKLLVLLALLACGLILGLGDQRIVAYTVPGSEPLLTVVAHSNDPLVPLDAAVDSGIQVLVSAAEQE